MSPSPDGKAQDCGGRCPGNELSPALGGLNCASTQDRWVIHDVFRQGGDMNDERLRAFSGAAQGDQLPVGSVMEMPSFAS